MTLKSEFLSPSTMSPNEMLRKHDPKNSKVNKSNNMSTTTQLGKSMYEIHKDNGYRFRLHKSKSFDDKITFNRWRNADDLFIAGIASKRLPESTRFYRLRFQEQNLSKNSDSKEQLRRFHARSKDPIPPSHSVATHLDSIHKSDTSKHLSNDRSSGRHHNKLQDAVKALDNVSPSPALNTHAHDLHRGHVDVTLKSQQRPTPAVHSSDLQAEPYVKLKGRFEDMSDYVKRQQLVQASPHGSRSIPLAPGPKINVTNSEENYKYANHPDDLVMKNRSRTETLSFGLHLTFDPSLVAKEEKRRLFAMRKQEELRKQMEGNPHLARRERMKVIEEKRLQDQARIAAAQQQLQRQLEEEERLRDAEDTRRKDRARRAAERKLSQERRLKQARLLREKQRQEHEQKRAAEEASRQAAHEAKLKAAEEARILALEEARQKADEMEAHAQRIKQEIQKKQIKEITRIENPCEVLSKCDIKFLMDDRKEMELLALRLRTDREIVEQAERLHRATMEEIYIRRQISNENDRRQREQPLRPTKSRSLPTLPPKRDSFRERDKERPKWGVGQTKAQYKKMSERDPTYQLRLQRRDRALRGPPMQTKHLPVTFTSKHSISERESPLKSMNRSDSLFQATPFVSPVLEAKPVMMDKSTSATALPIIPNVGRPETITITFDDQVHQPLKKTPYMSASARTVQLRARRALQEHNRQANIDAQVQVPETIITIRSIQQQPDQLMQATKTVNPSSELRSPNNVGNATSSRPSSTESEITEREHLVRHLLNRKRGSNQITYDQDLGPVSYYTIKLPDKYARSLQKLGFRKNHFL